MENRILIMTVSKKGAKKPDIRSIQIFINFFDVIDLAGVPL